MDEIIEDFERSRQECIESEQQVQIVGIVGFGGSGKTTLATELYNRKSSSFNRSSFLYDVRNAASKNALHIKQKKLLEDLRIQTVSFDNVREGKEIVADRLKSLCVLIVLDDVDHQDELDVLLPPKESLGSGSLVIVTTCEGDVLTRWGITSIYKMQPLQHFHARQLFCWHAFLKPFPQDGFEDLVDNYLDVCNGFPLSLKVIGGQLYGNGSKNYWDSQLNRIRRILPKEIMQTLRASYDALDVDEQEIFLDIACFFIGERRSLAIGVWDGSGWSGLYSWETLQKKCLDGEERISMCDHLRDLGREIATTRSPSRICSEGQSMHIQKRMPIRGIAATRGLSFCPPPFKEYMKMMRISNLKVGIQLLVVEKNDFTQEFMMLSTGLLWLRWFEFEERDIPSWLSLENIRVLELIEPWNLETLWEDAHPPLQLRELVIEQAPKLQCLPSSIGHLKHLKRLSLKQDLSRSSACETGFELSSLPEEFCRLHLLEHLVLRGCEKLSSLPNRFGDLVNLRHIDLSACDSLQRLPESFKELIHLEYLDLSGCLCLKVESNILENITNLKVFNFSGFSEVLPHNIINQTSLGKLDLSFASSLLELPASTGQLSKLKELEINYCESLISLPISFGNLSSLVTLTLECCDNLQSLPIEFSQLYSLQTLKIERCQELYEMPSLVGLVSLNNLTVKDCYKIKKIEGLGHLTSLEKLHVWTCWMVPGIRSLRGTERLRTLNLKADDISAFKACIQSIEIEKWPWDMTICAKNFPRVQSILDSFTFPGLAMVSSLETVNVFEPNDPLRPYWGRWSLTCWETNLSNAAMVCYLVHYLHDEGFISISGEGQGTTLHLSKGEWMVISVFREVVPLVKDGGHSLQASMDVFGFNSVKALSGRLMVGERGRIVEGFKQLFQTLCTSIS